MVWQIRLFILHLVVSFVWKNTDFRSDYYPRIHVLSVFFGLLLDQAFTHHLICAYLCVCRGCASLCVHRLCVCCVCLCASLWCIVCVSAVCACAHVAVFVFCKHHDLRMGENDDNSTCEHLCDPVLAYITMSLKNGTRALIKRVVLSHFTSKALTTAKDRLWGVYAAGLGQKKIRKGSPNKSKEELVIEDIMDGLFLLDENDVKTKIVVSVSDLQSLPKAMPEETLAISVVERLRALEDDMRLMKAGFLPANRKKVQPPQMQSQHLLQQPLQPLQPPQHPPPNQQGRSRSVTRAFAAQSQRDSSESTTSKSQEPEHEGTLYNPFDPDIPPFMKQQASLADMISGYDDKPFIEIKRKKQRAAAKRNKEGNAQAQASGGASNGLSGGSNTICVQLTNVNPQAAKETISDHITIQGIDASKVTISDTSTEGWPTKRFLVTVPRDMADKVLATTFWPPKVYFREFFAPKPRRFGTFNQQVHV